jgi:hypothetical protein
LRNNEARLIQPGLVVSSRFSIDYIAAAITLLKMASTNDILLYQTPDGQMQLEVQLANETVWLSQAQMVELFDTTKQNVSLHLRNLFREEELSEETSVKDSLILVSKGRKYTVKYYNLDVVISVGYRVSSLRGTHFRQWATNILRQYLVRGFVLNEKRLRESARQLADLKRLVQLRTSGIKNSQPRVKKQQFAGVCRVVTFHA